MQVWKVIPHHETPDEAVTWSIERGRIAVGWGRIGDLRGLKFDGPEAVTARIKGRYPDATNAHLGGPSLWNFFRKMDPGDLAIVSTRGRRFHVVEITGEYFWTSAPDSFGDYQHQRAAVPTDDDADTLWASVGERVLKGQNVRWTVALCAADVPAGATGSKSVRYSEGSRFDIVATRIERDPMARRACLSHHGFACLACGFNFLKVYGDLGNGFIHVHHLEPLAAGERPVDPERDLVPLCPNCHAMVHRTRPPLTLEQLKERMRR